MTCFLFIVNLLTEKESKKIYVFEVLIISKHTVTVNLKKFCLTLSWRRPFSCRNQSIELNRWLIVGNFTRSNSIILVEDLIRWKRDFEIFLNDHMRLILEIKILLVRNEKCLYQSHPPYNYAGYIWSIIPRFM